MVLDRKEGEVSTEAWLGCRASAIIKPSVQVVFYVPEIGELPYVRRQLDHPVLGRVASNLPRKV